MNVILSEAYRGPRRQVFVAGVGSKVEGPAVVLAFVFLVVIPEGNLLFVP